ncbi:collagen alpha-1(X) chain-like isoform X2 [Dreissena polymorpha]|uniref:collagen alpha-1(X) chain-like isoform X2 n=1 Tax=Dreissena polymorpha TaxID=45954 RepID=UPI0022652A20|nr:collagen alpha-1(X) chain-like isoform X2 [Dreissena polymorpha]
MTQNASITGLQLKKENEILKDQLTIPFIYFHANAPAAYHLVTGQDVIYTDVRVNEGQGYDPKTGIFTVSVPGLYLFTVHYNVYYSTYTYLAITHQGIQIQPSFSHSVSGEFATFSMQVFIRAAMSDKIWVESTHRDTKLHGSDPHNSFSGALIHM